MLHASSSFLWKSLVNNDHEIFSPILLMSLINIRDIKRMFHIYWTCAWGKRWVSFWWCQAIDTYMYTYIRVKINTLIGESKEIYQISIYLIYRLKHKYNSDNYLQLCKKFHLLPLFTRKEIAIKTDLWYYRQPWTPGQN